MRALGLTGRRGRVAALLAVLLAVAVAVSWWTHPSAIQADGDRIAVRVAVGRPADVVVAPSLPSALTLRSVEPVVPAGVARADVEVLLCGVLDDGSGVVSSNAGDLMSTCTSVRPAEPGTRTRSDESLLVRITPRERGDVELTGLRIGYSRDARHLWQRGIQELTTAVRVTTP